MPPKRKRADGGADAGPSTRSTRKSARTDRGKGNDTQDNINTDVSSTAATGASIDVEKARTTALNNNRATTRASSARGRGARAVQMNDDQPTNPSTNLSLNDHGLEEIKQGPLKVPPNEEYTLQRSHDLFKNFADVDTSNVVGPEGVEKLCMAAGIPLDGAQPLILAWQCGCQELGRITRDEWVRGTETLRISSLPVLALALKELDDLVVHNNPPIKRPPTSTSTTRRGNPAASKANTPYNRGRYWTYAQNSQVAFNELYQFCFTLSKPQQSRNIDLETAVALWSVLLTVRYPIINEITAFLNENGSYRGANKDIWSMVYEFCRTIHPNLDNYETDGAWPTMLDDFVAWKRGKVSTESADP